jgi:hypothetical protein
MADGDPRSLPTGNRSCSGRFQPIHSLHKEQQTAMFKKITAAQPNGGWAPDEYRLKPRRLHSACVGAEATEKLRIRILSRPSRNHRQRCIFERQD